MGMAVKWRATGAGGHRFLRGLDPPRRRRVLDSLGSLAYPARWGGLSCSPPGGFEPAAGGRDRGGVAELGLDLDDVAQEVPPGGWSWNPTCGSPSLRPSTPVYVWNPGRIKRRGRSRRCRPRTHRRARPDRPGPISRVDGIPRPAGTSPGSGAWVGPSRSSASARSPCRRGVPRQEGVSRVGHHATRQPPAAVRARDDPTSCGKSSGIATPWPTRAPCSSRGATIDVRRPAVATGRRRRRLEAAGMGSRAGHMADEGRERGNR